MKLSEVSDLYLVAICLQMQQEDPKLFQIFLEKQHYIRERYENFLAIVPLDRYLESLA